MDPLAQQDPPARPLLLLAQPDLQAHKAMLVLQALQEVKAHKAMSAPPDLRAYRATQEILAHQDPLDPRARRARLEMSDLQAQLVLIPP